MKAIYLAGGCFWGTQHYISQFEGVLATEVGYANGHVTDPTYKQVYTDQTGHAECVKVEYDPEVISLKTLCRLFFKSIDPLLKDRQGEDVGTRYRTGVYWVDESDAIVVNEVFAEVQKKYNEPLAVEKCPLDCFYTGEEYHQKYLVKNPDGYCHLSPSLMKSAKTYALITKELRQCSDENEVRKVMEKFNEAQSEVLEWLKESECDKVRLFAHILSGENTLS